jgi:two-component sensor histidine kinase
MGQGHGLPEDFDLHESDSMGSQLIVSFLEQLRADIEWFTDEGTCFHVTIPSN